MGSQAFTANNAAWPWPSFVVQVTAECWGGGGGSGGVSGNPAAGGGGRGGGYARVVINKGAESTLAIVVGAGGTAGSAGNGGAGGVSSVDQGGTIRARAVGGGGGLGGSTNVDFAGGTTDNGTATGTTTFSGGSGATGNAASGGGAGGGVAGSAGAGTAGSGTTGGTGRGPAAGAGNGATGVATSTAGAVGNNYGGGASGGRANAVQDRAGAVGGPGYVLITWVDPLTQAAADPLSLGEAMVRVPGWARVPSDALVLDETFVAIMPATGREILTEVDDFLIAEDGHRLAQELAAVLLTQDISDGIAFGETRSGAAGFDRARTDTLAMAEALTKVAAFLRSLGEPISMSDSRALALTIQRSLADGLSVGEVIASVRVLVRAMSEGMTLDEVVARAMSFRRSPIDPLALADLLTKVAQLVRSDALSLGESLAKAIQRSLSEGISVGEVVAALKLASRILTDGMTLGEQATLAAVFRRFPADPLAIVEALSKTTAFVRASADALSLAENFVKSASFLRSLSDAAALSEAVTKSLVIQRFLSETLSLSELVARVLLLARVISDGLGLGEVIAKVAAYKHSRTEPLSLSETLGRMVGWARADALGLTDSSARAGIFGRSLVDSTHLSEAVEQVLARFLQQTSGDALFLSEGVAPLIVALSKMLANGISLSEAVAKLILVGRQLVEPLTLSEALATRILAQALLEGMSLGEAIGALILIGRGFAEPLALSESVLLALTSRRGYEDGLSLGDGSANATSFRRFPSDAVLLGELSEGLQPARLSLLPFANFQIVSPSVKVPLFGSGAQFTIITAASQLPISAPSAGFVIPSGIGKYISASDPLSIGELLARRGQLFDRFSLGEAIAVKSLRAFLANGLTLSEAVVPRVNRIFLSDDLLLGASTSGYAFTNLLSETGSLLTTEANNHLIVVGGEIRITFDVGETFNLGDLIATIKRPNMNTDPLNRSALGMYENFPHMARLSGGELMCVWSRGFSHEGIGAEGAAWSAVSTDNGTTWATETRLPSLIATSLFVTSAGTILITEVTWDGIHGSTFVWRSSDQGLTWSRVAVPDQHQIFTWCDGEMWQLTDGTILMPVYGTDNDSTNYKFCVVRSTNDGLSWGLPSNKIGGAGSKAWCEAAIIKVGTTLLAIVRNETDNRMDYTTSANNGLTWSAPVLAATGVKGRPCIARLASGRLVLGTRAWGGVGRAVLRHSMNGTSWSATDYNVDSVDGFNNGSTLIETTPGNVLVVLCSEAGLHGPEVNHSWLRDGLHSEAAIAAT